MKTVTLATAFALTATLAAADSVVGVVDLDANNNPVGEPEFTESPYNCDTTMLLVQQTTQNITYVNLGNNQYIAFGPDGSKAAVVCVEK